MRIMDAANQKEAKRPRMIASMGGFGRPYPAMAAGSNHSSYFRVQFGRCWQAGRSEGFRELEFVRLIGKFTLPVIRMQSRQARRNACASADKIPLAGRGSLRRAG